jgi:dihydroneopterin aldolase
MRARVRVEKPQALERAQAAGVEIVLGRAGR